MSSNTKSAPKWRATWVIIASGCLISFMTFGPRSAMGFFQLPMLEDTGWDRTTFGLAMAIQNLFWGIAQPVMGAIADKYGSWRVLALGGIIYAVGLWMMADGSAPVWLIVGGGVLVGTGVGSAGFGVILAVFARSVEEKNRSFVFGLGTAAGSFGMFAFAPISQGLISTYGWSDTLIYLSAIMLIIPVLAIPLFGNAESAPNARIEVAQTVAQALQEAVATKGYTLLIAGFFVCGFQVAFITAHFPAYISDLGIGARYAVIAISLIGAFNVIGSLASGVIGQKYSKPKFLVFIYLGRSFVVTIFLLLPASPTSIIIFSIIMGLLWLSTVPPTNALVAVMFGTRHLGLLGGIVFFSHQIGSFLGVWLGGYLYDRIGTFDPVWWISVGLGIFAALVHWPIVERPVERLRQPAE